MHYTVGNFSRAAALDMKLRILRSPKRWGVRVSRAFSSRGTSEVSSRRLQCCYGRSSLLLLLKGHIVE
eukprot:scaffold8266_cov175-Amphora_coffeaeformis.AAC.3